MCCSVIEFVSGRARYHYYKPQFIFVPNDTVPGQDECAMLDFKKLQIPVDDINRLFGCFLEIDTDGSGEISLDEFYAHFELKRSIFSDMAFSLMDEDKSGEIDFREFILTLWNFCSYDFKELCRFAFFLFDSDESGKLESEEVTDMVKSVYGEHFADDERVKRVLDCLDANGDGEVSISEWIMFNKKYPLLLFPAYQMQGKLREKVIGKWWWDIMQQNRADNFKNANIYDILEKIEEENIKFGDVPVKEEVNDISSSPLKGLPSEQRPADYDAADPEAREREEDEEAARAKSQAAEDARQDKFKNNSFLQILREQRARPPDQQTSLKGWNEPKGPGVAGYHTGAKKSWNDAPRMQYIEGRGMVNVGAMRVNDGGGRSVRGSKRRGSGQVVGGAERIVAWG
ncbi:hypothetical protein TrLO_g4447 [Triparma laevis f. longispina]|uniref:EF-hand domain-containing protein n=1 Tax=Triparma laevis f. longispina TaxID=1714387 RepID=A0A9W7FT78_9STRA|nr:hypothetical protein TrLO_g4447 [Triparma laevis f. longispina]